MRSPWIAKRRRTPYRPPAHVFYVYDARTVMDEFVASFAVRADADDYGARRFGEHAIVLDRRCHADGRVWNGRTETGESE